MAALVHQEAVIKWIKNQVHYDIIHKEASQNGDTGPDLVLGIDGKLVFFEAIAYTEKPKGKNQSDFWKAFAQAISRLNPNSEHGKPDSIVLALPIKFWTGWKERTEIHGNDVWKTIGNAFPMLYIWFVGENEIKQFTWNDSYDVAHS